MLIGSMKRTSMRSAHNPSPHCARASSSARNCSWPFEASALTHDDAERRFAPDNARIGSAALDDGRRIEDELAAHRGAPGEHPRLEQAARLRFDARVPLDRAGRGEVARDALDSSPFDPPAALVA